MRWLALRWRRFSFSLRFTLILAVMGALIAAVPLILAASEARAAASSRASDHIRLASSLLESERASLQAYATALSAQLGQPGVPSQLATAPEILARDSRTAGSDVVGLIGTTTTMAEGGATLPGGSGFSRSVGAAVTSGVQTFSDDQGFPWLLATTRLSPGQEGTVFTARRLTSNDLGELVVLVHNGNTLVYQGTVGATVQMAGSRLDAVTAYAVAVATNGGVVIAHVGDLDQAVAAAPMGAGYSLVVSAPVGGLAGLGTPELLLLGLILIAMLLIVATVRSSLQVPLRRLDRAVAALAIGDFDVPVAAPETDDEIGRLAHTFEVIRGELQATLQISRARAAIASELNAAQPLQSALTKVCGELQAATCAEAALIIVGGSEMTDSFVAGTGRSSELDAEALLLGSGPLGEAFRRGSRDAVILGALPGTPDDGVGLRVTCAAPLVMGSSRIGVIAVTAGSRELDGNAIELLGSTAGQVALALERYRFLAVVQRQASIDDLTGLYNHRFMVDYLNQQVALAERLQTPLAILMLDIDHFKKLNDTHGHGAGDTALAAFAECLKGTVRRADLATRYGGEEFVVVMSNTGREDALLVAEKIRAAVEALEVPIHDGADSVAITVSIGVAAYPEDTTSAATLLRLADEALYAAKGGGRNRVVAAPLDRVAR